MDSYIIETQKRFLRMYVGASKVLDIERKFAYLAENSPENVDVMTFMRLCRKNLPKEISIKNKSKNKKQNNWKH